MRATRSLIVAAVVLVVVPAHAELVTSVFNGRVPCVPVRHLIATAGFGGAEGGAEVMDSVTWVMKNATGEVCPTPAGP
jgi:hypothetical protein